MSTAPPTSTAPHVDAGATLTRLGAAISSAGLPVERVGMYGSTAPDYLRYVHVVVADEAAVRVWADYLGTPGDVYESTTPGVWFGRGYLHGVEIFVSTR